MRAVAVWTINLLAYFAEAVIMRFPLDTGECEGCDSTCSCG